MALLALISMICGPVVQKDIVEAVEAKNCYKNLILCVERKQLLPKVTVDDAITSCILEY